MEPTNNFLSITKTFILNKNEKIFIRIFWFLIILSSFLCLAFYIGIAYSKYVIAPVIHIQIVDKPIDWIPFPSLTICPSTFVKNDLVKLTVDTTGYTDHQKHLLAANLQSCHPIYSQYFDDCCGNRTDQNVVDLLQESFMTVDEMFAFCYFNHFEKNCSHFINRVLTDRGFCYNINALSFHSIFDTNTISDDFKSYKIKGMAKSFKKSNSFFEDDEVDKYPVWTIKNGFNLSYDEFYVPVKSLKNTLLEFHFHLDKINADNVCIPRGKTFYFFFHSPNEILTPLAYESFVEFGYAKKVTIKIDGYSTNFALMNFPPASRNCYYEDERKLKFFKMYAQRHCEFECLANYTLEKCGCVRFSMPRTNDTRVCGMKDISCYVEASRTWPLYEPEKESEVPCGCLKDCNYLKYSTKSEKNSRYSDLRLMRRERNITEGSVSSYLAFEIGDHFHYDYQYYAPYTLQNFIADIGGLLGLFLGFSMISVVECCYALINAVFNKHRKLRENAHQTEEAKDKSNVAKT